MAEKIFRSFFFRKFLYLWIVYSLIADCIRNNLCNATQDMAFNVLFVFVIIWFTLEILLQSSFDMHYRLSIFFWIDILCLLMTIYEFPWLQSAM